MAEAFEGLASLVEFVTGLRTRLMPHLADPGLDEYLDPADPHRTRHQLATFLVLANLWSQYGQERVQLLVAEAAVGPREILRVQTAAGEFDIDVRADDQSASRVSAGPAGSLFAKTQQVEQPFFFSVDIYNALLALAEASQVQF